MRGSECTFLLRRLDRSTLFWNHAVKEVRIMQRMKAIVAGVGLITAVYSAWAASQQPIYYPAKGQSAQQQNRDRGECQVWAQQTTGINPAALAQGPAPTPAPSGPAVGGGERVAGAVRGAIIGEVAGGHGGEGAVVGAMVGGAKARRNQTAQAQAQQQQAQAAHASQVNTYNRAVGACMEGRGYTVK